MRVFYKENLRHRMGTQDYQLLSLSLGGALNKWYYPDENLVIKEAKFLSSILPYQSHIVESFGSMLCKWLSVNSVEQVTCEIADDDGSKVASSYCHDYRKSNEEYVTMTQLLAQDGCDMNEFSKLSGMSKISRVERLLAKKQIAHPIGYIRDMCLVDFLLLNPDRHTNNFGILFNTKTFVTKAVPLFDFGMGLKAYDRISLTASIDVDQEIESQNPFAVPFKDSLSRFKAEWGDALESLPAEEIILESMAGLSGSRQDLFFKALSRITG